MSHHETSRGDGDTNRAVLERMFAAIEAQDWDGMLADFADDFVQSWPQSGERINGKQQCLAIYRNYPGGSPAISVKRITGTGDTLVAESVMRYGDKPVHGIHIFEFRDGKVVGETDYWAEPFDPPAWRSEWVSID